jgi:hypothetical protein
MNPKERHLQQQTPLPLTVGAHWSQLPPEVREQCRTLLVELLTRLARRPATGGGDDER